MVRLRLGVTLRTKERDSRLVAFPNVKFILVTMEGEEGAAISASKREKGAFVNARKDSKFGVVDIAKEFTLVT